MTTGIKKVSLEIMCSSFKIKLKTPDTGTLCGQVGT